MAEVSTAAILAGIATLSEVTTAGMVVVADITGVEVIGMVAVTTVEDIGTEIRIGGGVIHSVSGTMTTITKQGLSDDVDGKTKSEIVTVTVAFL